MFQADKKPILFNKELSGGIVTFNSRLKNMPLSRCEITIPVTQTGSGTPSPDNIREFITFSSVTIGQTKTSGYDEYFQDLLNGTYSFVDLGSLSWYINESYPGVFYSSRISGSLPDSKNNVCSGYQYNGNANNRSLAVMADRLSDKEMCTFAETTGNVRRFVVKDLDYNDSAAFKTAVSGAYLIYELETPTTPTITSQEFATLCQAFGIIGNTYIVSFGQSIYSGIFDVKTGILTITHELKTYDGSENWVMQNTPSRGYYFKITDASYQGIIYANEYLGGEPQSSAGMDENECALNVNMTSLLVKPQNTLINDLDAFKAYLAQNNLKVLYELATPIEIILDGHTIEAVKGVNNIFASIGNTTIDYVEVK